MTSATPIVNEVATPTVTPVTTPTVTTPTVTSIMTGLAETPANQPSNPVTAAVADDTAIAGYTPVFSATVRTVVYLVCAILGVLGAACAIASYASGAPLWLTLTATILAVVAPYIANVFGVAYNPLKMAGK